MWRMGDISKRILRLSYLPGTRISTIDPRRGAGIRAVTLDPRGRPPAGEGEMLVESMPMAPGRWRFEVKKDGRMGMGTSWDGLLKHPTPP